MKNQELTAYEETRARQYRERQLERAEYQSTLNNQSDLINYVDRLVREKELDKLNEQLIKNAYDHAEYDTEVKHFQYLVISFPLFEASSFPNIVKRMFEVELKASWWIILTSWLKRSQNKGFYQKFDVDNLDSYLSWQTYVEITEAKVIKTPALRKLFIFLEEIDLNPKLRVYLLRSPISPFYSITKSVWNLIISVSVEFDVKERMLSIKYNTNLKANL